MLSEMQEHKHTHKNRYYILFMCDDIWEIVSSFFTTLELFELWELFVSKAFHKNLAIGFHLIKHLHITANSDFLPLLITHNANSVHNLFWHDEFLTDNYLVRDTVFKLLQQNNHIIRAYVPLSIFAMMKLDHTKALIIYTLRKIAKFNIQIKDATQLEKLSIYCWSQNNATNCENMLIEQLPLLYNLHSLHVMGLLQNLIKIKMVLPTIRKFSCQHRIKCVDDLIKVFPNIIIIGSAHELENNALKGQPKHQIQIVNISDVLQTNTLLFKKFPSLNTLIIHGETGFIKDQSLTQIISNLRDLFKNKLVNNTNVYVPSSNWMSGQDFMNLIQYSQMK